MSNPILTFGDANFKRIEVKWYIPCCRSRNESTPYLQWNTAEQFKGEVDQNFPLQWTSTYNILTSWKSRRASDAIRVNIPKKQITIAVNFIAQLQMLLKRRVTPRMINDITFVLVQLIISY